MQQRLSDHHPATRTIPLKRAVLTDRTPSSESGPGSPRKGNPSPPKRSPSISRIFSCSRINNARTDRHRPSEVKTPTLEG